MTIDGIALKRIFMYKLQVLPVIYFMAQAQTDASTYQHERNSHRIGMSIFHHVKQAMRLLSNKLNEL